MFSPVYVNALVIRDRDTDANGSLDERLYFTSDANYDVTSAIDTSGTVQHSTSLLRQLRGSVIRRLVLGESAAMPRAWPSLARGTVRLRRGHVRVPAQVVQHEFDAVDEPTDRIRGRLEQVFGICCESFR